MQENLRLCFRKLVLGLACLCLLDVTIGGLSRFVFFQQRSGKFHRIHEAMAIANQRLFIFGSSHAASHYVPVVLTEELGVSSYNAGALGQQILFHKTLQSIVLERTTPDVIVLDVDPSSLYEAPAFYDRLADLRPFYFLYPSIIGPVLGFRSSFEGLFLRSKLYQYNSTFVHVIRYWVAPQADFNGYRPRYEVMRTPTVEEERIAMADRRTSDRGRKLDPVMVNAMERFGADAIGKKIKLFYCVSPGALPYDLQDNASFRTLMTIADHSRIPFFNFRNHPDFVRQYALFFDSGHLNDLGARRYSKLVADTIRGHLTAKAFQRD